MKGILVIYDLKVFWSFY